MFKLIYCVYIVCVHVVTHTECVNMLHTCSNLSETDVFCQFIEKCDYGVTTSYPNDRIIQFNRLTNSRMNAKYFPSLTYLMIMNRQFDELERCEH